MDWIATFWFFGTVFSLFVFSCGVKILHLWFHRRRPATCKIIWFYTNGNAE